MEIFRKVRAKARKTFHSRTGGGSHESDGPRSESRSLPPAMDDNRQPSALKNANPTSSYQSLSASIHHRNHRTQAHQAEARDIDRPHPTGQFSQPVISMPVPPSTPWEAWTLDQDFLAQVYTWNTKHPENNLNHVFKKVSTAIEHHEVLFELVPDGPIPIRGFVKALAHIVKLGISMADAKLAALNFAQSVLQWVEKLAAAFGTGGSGRFISNAWDNLADIREWIEGVCTWAHRMLNVSIIERASVNNQIMGFQTEFTKAIERFGVVSNIHIAIGQDHTHRRLDNLNRTLEDRLPQRQATIPNATFQIQNKIPCDPGTRKQVLAEIMNWICDISEGSPCFFWLSGDPGVGKSAVTASIARDCIRRNILWAQYFINRNDASTVDPQLYFPSIAKQMSQRSDAVDYAVQNIIKEQPYLMKDDISVQATELFIKAVQVASESTPNEPIAIVIDALDETDVKRLQVTAEIFSRILVDLPRNVKVFISSRVEDVIRDNFAHHPRARKIHLSTGNSVADVTRFLETNVQGIMANHKIKWSEWGPERMGKLCAQASGLFIWAVTAIEYIRTEIEESGRECLDIVLDELNAKGMGNINMLYQAILKRTYRREMDPWQIQRFRRIVGAILAQQSPLSISDLQELLDLRNPKTGTPVDIEHFVRRLRTLLVAGVAEINSRTFPRVHKSFTDFITSSKAEEFRVDMTESNGELAIQCIHQLSQLWKHRHEMPPQPRYAMLHWSSHLTNVVGVPVLPEVADDDAASSFDAQSLSSNLEKDTGSSILVNLRPIEKLAGHLGGYSISVSLDRSCIAYASGNSVLLRDIETGSLIGNPFDGHTDNVSSATFSPDGRYIVSASYDQSICIWDVETGKMVLDPLTGHSRWVLAATFSPDGSQIVSCSIDDTIRIWDTKTGRCIHVLQGHAGSVYSANFSPDGTHIVSASGDKTVCVWNALTGAKVHTFTNHNTEAFLAFFTPNSKHIISCSQVEIIIFWDFETHERITNSCVDGASLSFTGSGSSPYIITPQMSNTAVQSTATPSSPASSFRLAGAGIAGGIDNTWLYFDMKNKFIMSTYLGRLTIHRTF